MPELPLEHVSVDPDAQPDAEAAPPAVFVLHGRGADETDLLAIAQHLPDELHVISFKAPDRLQAGYTWYELDLSGGGLHQSQPHAADFRRSLDLVAESVAAAVEAYDLDPDRLGLLGFSQGAITSLSLLVEDPDRFAWVVALHGYLADAHETLEPAGIEGKPIFLGAGNADRIIPHTRAAAAADRLEAIGADVSFTVYDAPHGVGEDELSDLVAFVRRHV
ncbi:MAG: alpha/beta hydrolase [Halobacteriota archaeon]